MAQRDQGRMATTLTVSLFRNNEVTIGHVGDCRVYLVQRGLAQQITTDHSYAAMQLRLGLISPQEAATSDMRCVLTRSLGKDPTIQVDYYTVPVNRRRLPGAVFRRDAQLHCPRRVRRDRDPRTRPRTPAGNWWRWRKSAAPTIISPCKSCGSTASKT